MRVSPRWSSWNILKARHLEEWRGELQQASQSDKDMSHDKFPVKSKMIHLNYRRWVPVVSIQISDTIMYIVWPWVVMSIKMINGDRVELLCSERSYWGQAPTCDTTTPNQQTLHSWDLINMHFNGIQWHSTALSCCGCWSKDKSAIIIIYTANPDKYTAVSISLQELHLQIHGFLRIKDYFYWIVLFLYI